MPCPGPFHFSHIADYIYDFCPLPDPDVGLSILVCDVEHTSFHFRVCGRKFVLCLLGQCPVAYQMSVKSLDTILRQSILEVKCYENNHFHFLT